MAHTLKSLHCFAIMFVFILIANSELMMVEANLCERASLTWSGDCKVTSHCDSQCKTWESAKHGACHKRQSKWKCFCYFDCKQKTDQKP